jgi:ribose transport system substrate-binding protein
MAVDQGVKVVFMDNCPDGFTAGPDYACVVSSDNYGNGAISAHLMAKALGGQGKIAAIYYEADYFVTNQRYQGFKETLTSNYPDIQIIAERGISGSDLAGSAQKQADALLSQNADLNGIWAVWDVPAEGVIAAARSASRTDLGLASEDLGKNVAIAMAQGQYVCGLGAQRPYDAGVTEANAAAKALLGQSIPAFIALSPLAVTKDNVADAWRSVYHTDPPEEVRQALEA